MVGNKQEKKKISFDCKTLYIMPSAPPPSSEGGLGLALIEIIHIVIYIENTILWLPLTRELSPAGD